jgi:hypothetical protein
VAVVRKTNFLERLLKRAPERASAVIVCRSAGELFRAVERAKASCGWALVLTSREVPTPSLVHASREIPVVAADNPDEALPLLEALRLPLEPGLYEARARLIKWRDQERALSELELAASEMVEGWPAVVAVLPPSWPELRVAGVLEVRAEGVCGVLALRRVV